MKLKYINAAVGLIFLALNACDPLSPERNGKKSPAPEKCQPSQSRNAKGQCVGEVQRDTSDSLVRRIDQCTTTEGFTWDEQQGCIPKKVEPDLQAKIDACNADTTRRWDDVRSECVAKTDSDLQARIDACRADVTRQWDDVRQECVARFDPGTGTDSGSGTGTPTEYILTATRNTFLISPAGEKNCYIAVGSKLTLETPAKAFEGNDAQKVLKLTRISGDLCTLGDWNILHAHFE